MTEGGHLVDEAIDQGATPFPPYSSIEFSPEPYQKVTVYLSGTDEDFDKRAVAYALKIFHDGARYYEAEFAPQAQTSTAGNQAAYGSTAASNTSQRPQEAPQRPRTNERRGKVNYGNCPDHPDVQAIPSKREYQEYDEVDGEQVPAKFFCPGDQNGTGQNHSLWRSQLIEVI